MQSLNFAQKISLIKKISDEIIMDSDKKFRKINDLLLFTEDPKSIDVVQKAVQHLCKVFIEIIPAFRIREDINQKNVDDAKGADKGKQLSKDVASLRSFESFLLDSYKQYLQILE